MRPNHAYLLLSILSLLMAIGSCPGVLVAADAFQAAPSTLSDGESGVLLLYDGGLLAGRICNEADGYVVERNGSQMHVAATRVMFVGRSPREAYEFRRARTGNDPLRAHLTLAEWCLRLGLDQEAAVELGEARRLEPRHPRVELLERRLAANQLRGKQQQHPAEGPPPVANASTVAARAGEPGLGVAASSRVVLATANVPIAAKTTSATNTPSIPPSLREPNLDNPDVPPRELEHFTRKVQPILVNSCTTSRCHEPGGSQAFQLNRAVLRGESNRRSTMQNLSATLALVDRENPTASKLLTIPRQSHGGMNNPLFGPRQDAAFKHLADWVEMLAPSAQPVPETAAEPQRLAPPPQAKPLDAAGTASNHMPTNHAAPVAVDTTQPREPREPREPIATSSPPTLRSPHTLQFGAKARAWQPRDEFDPELFNRRHHPTKPSEPQAPRKEK